LIQRAAVIIIYRKEGISMIKNVIQHGNEKAVVIEKTILDLLGISEDTPLEVLTDGNRMIITPIREDAQETGRKMAFEDALNWVNENYRESLSNLAK
jgi:antitoxin component of MazEF toxin-antitoxin module